MSHTGSRAGLVLGETLPRKARATQEFPETGQSDGLDPRHVTRRRRVAGARPAQGRTAALHHRLHHVTAPARRWDLGSTSPERFSRSADRRAVNAMITAITIAAFLVLIAGGAYVIHRLNSAHADRIASRSYSRFQPGRPSAADRAADTAAPPPPPSARAAPHERRDHGDDDRGRLRPRWHRNRTTRGRHTAEGRRDRAARQD